MAESTKPKIVPREPTAFQNFVAGGVGGIVVVLIGHPFDTVKVRMQTQAAASPGVKPPFTGMFDCFRQTVRQEGFRGLYKGVPAPLVGVTPYFALSFYGYGFGKKLQMKTPTQELSITQHVLAGGISGFFTTMVAAPGERIKCLMQIQRESKAAAKYASSFDCAVKLYREGGVRNIFKGTVATLLRDVPSGASYFGTYEWLMRKMSSAEKGRHELSVPRILFAGGMAGVVNWLVILPPDVAKSRIQTAPPGMYRHVGSAFMELIREGGLAALYKGMSPVMFRAFPANAGAFLGFELTIKLMRNLNE